MDKNMKLDWAIHFWIKHNTLLSEFPFAKTFTVNIGNEYNTMLIRKFNNNLTTR